MLHRSVLAVNQRPHLLLCCRYHARVTVPGANYPDTRGEVEVSSPLNIINRAAKCMVDGNWGGLVEMWCQSCHEVSHISRLCPIEGTSIAICRHEAWDY